MREASKASATSKVKLKGEKKLLYKLKNPVDNTTFDTRA